MANGLRTENAEGTNTSIKCATQFVQKQKALCPVRNIRYMANIRYSPQFRLHICAFQWWSNERWSTPTKAKQGPRIAGDKQRKLSRRKRYKWKVKYRAGDDVPLITVGSKRQLGIKPETSCYNSRAHPVGKQEASCMPRSPIEFFQLYCKVPCENQQRFRASYWSKSTSIQRPTDWGHMKVIVKQGLTQTCCHPVDVMEVQSTVS